jgi:uracil-DNA glycosylase family 4
MATILTPDRNRPKKVDTTVPCAECCFGGPRVGSRGNPKARIVVVAEAPGTQELITGIPLFGPSGKVFWNTIGEALRVAGLDANEDIYVLNAMQCLPPRGKIGESAQKNTARLSQGVRICNQRLMGQILEHPREIIITMGNHALHSVTGNYGHKITMVRGKLIPSNASRLGILPVIHPAALLRGTGNYRQFKMDLFYAVDLATRGEFALKRPVEPDFVMICDTFQKLAQCVRELWNAKYVAADIETGGFNRWNGPDGKGADEILCIGLAADPKRIFVVPEKYVHILGILFRRPSIRFIWHNGKFDIGFLRQLPGCERVSVGEDTMLLSYALDEGGGIHDLEQVAGDLIGAPDYKNMLKPYLPNKKTSYRVIPKDVLYKYLSLDVSNTLQIWQIMRPWVARDKRLETLYTRVLLPASELLYHIEQNGLELCPLAVKVNRKRLQKEIDDAELRLNAVCKKYGSASVNPNSPTQLAVLLYDVIKLKPKRAGDRSTDADHLDDLAKHPVVAAIQAYRKAAKAKSTYVDSLEKHTRPDGRVHATYLIHGTRTGRLSSRKPNMQNQPRDRRIRGMFYAGRGRVYIKADLNQAELRSLTLLSKDDYLLEVYSPNSKRSLHKETAKDFFGGDWLERYKRKEVKAEDELMRAKAVNFGIVYGRTAESLAEEFNIPPEEARRWIEVWFARSPKAKKFIQSCRDCVLEGKTMLTPFGRKKRHHIVTQENLRDLQNEASNFPHQAIASDINILGAAKARPLLACLGFFPVNIVHDEIMFEGPDDPALIKEAKDILVKCMQAIPVEWGLTAVGFVAEADVGRRWSIWRKELVS